MPSFSTEVTHSLGQEAAKQRLDSFLGKLQEKYKDQISDMDGTWNENVLEFRFTTYGIKINGTMTVEEDRVVMKGELPFAAMMFKGKIVSGIEEALGKALR